MLAVAVALAAAVGAPGVATARVRSATDHLAGVRFTLNARNLTLTLAPQKGHTPPDARKKLYGRSLRASCGLNDANGRPVPTGVTFLKFRWERGRLRRKVRLPRDISATAGWCIVETVSGGDIAFVDLKLGHNPDE
jgi:hypothetical protein